MKSSPSTVPLSKALMGLRFSITPRISKRPYWQICRPRHIGLAAPVLQGYEALTLTGVTIG
ncbi:hypothetical protein N8Z54_02745 [Octadecabacter sp.]|nr:hypothetical protein [Octadecabacter sp.]